MAGVVEFACPHCQRVSRVSAELAGKQARCPGCRKVFEIPRPAPGRPEPARPPGAARPGPAPPPAPEAGSESLPQATASEAPSQATPAPKKEDVGALLRSLPKLLLLGLVTAAVFPGLGAIPCAIYALRSPPGSPAKRWARIGLLIAALTTMVHFTLLNAQPKPPPAQGGQQPRRIAPRPR